MEDFGVRLKAQRQVRAWTVRHLGRLARVDAGWISRLESGERRNISVDAAARLAVALGVSLDYLVGLTPQARPWMTTPKRRKAHVA